MKKIKQFLFVALVWTQYKVVFKKKSTFSVNHWKYAFVPRKVSITISLLSISPIIILVGGIIGLIESFRKSMSEQSYTSYYIVSKEQPNKYDCYLKF